MKKALLFLFSLLSTTVAFSQPTKPEVCPSPANIAAEGFDMISQHPFNDKAWMIVKYKSKYDTSDEWSFFMMAPLDTTNESQATYEITQLLKKLTFMAGPGEGNHGSTDCYYAIDGSEHSFAIASNPAIEKPADPKKLLQMMKAKS